MNARRICFFLGCLLIAACSPKVTSSLTSSYPPLDPSEEVYVVELNAPEPENAEFLGSFKIGDSGFTSNKNGSYEAVIELARQQARLAGGNVVRIRRHQKPDMKSTIHRITADILRVQDPEALVLEESQVINSDHPDYAIVYFYRDGSAAGAFVNYTVNIGEEKVYRCKPGTKAEVKIFEEGTVEIWARTEARVTVPLQVKLGGEYYVRCSVDMGAFVGRPNLEQVSASSGKAEYGLIDSK